MKKSQSAIEAAMLISFMSFALIIFLVASYQRAIEAQEKNEKEILSDLISIIETELNLAAAASDGYYRIFELPPLLNGREYDITFVEAKYIGANFSEVEVRYLNKSLVDNAVTPANIIGRICKGRNLIAKTAGIANISCIECSNLADDDLNNCIDYPADLGCSSPDDPSESGGICSGECNDAQDNDFNGCADYPYDTGCSSASDPTESGGTCQCSDGTPFGSCGENGDFCSGGNLIDACGAPQNCGCNLGFTCQGNACIPTTIDCTITASCSDTDLFHISNSTNAHAEISILFNYPNKVCCGSAEPIDTSCTSPDTKLIALSATTNAHVEKIARTDYPIEVCMSSLASTITCSYITAAGNGFTACTSAGYDTCAVSISADTDAHVADCTTDPYDIKVCCKIGV